ncbi:uncharacterized protein [Dysidea avara]|uniref:uncharacterized protein n=1 Tax=Dysidea avara TaxID=196820 RepID=UPI00331D6B02
MTWLGTRCFLREYKIPEPVYTKMPVTQADLDAVKEQQKKAVTAFKNQDYDTLVKLHTEDSTFVPAGSKPIKGRETLGKVVEQGSKTGIAELKMSSGELQIMGEYIFDTHETQLFDKDGKVMDTMNTAIIWRKEPDGQWLIYFEMANSQTPPKR